jgi:hypothetical protein
MSSAAIMGPIVHPVGDTSMDNHGGITSTGETPDPCTRALWHSFQYSSGNKSGGTGEGNNKFCRMKYLFGTSNGSLTCIKF